MGSRAPLEKVNVFLLVCTAPVPLGGGGYGAWVPKNQASDWVRASFHPISWLLPWGKPHKAVSAGGPSPDLEQRGGGRGGWGAGDAQERGHQDLTAWPCGSVSLAAHSFHTLLLRAFIHSFTLGKHLQ